MTPAKPSYVMQALFGKDPPGDIASHVPHARFLGMSVLELGPGFAVYKLPYNENLAADRNTGLVFGGAITTLLDQASGLSVFCSLSEFKAIATLDLRIDYLRAAEPGCDLYGRAECYRLTKNVGFVRGTAWDRDPNDPFAGSLATFMIGANATETPLAKFVERQKAMEGGQQ